MIIISHRGNIRGPVLDRENAPSYIDCALGNGYDVEIDVRAVNGELWLGHDEPQYKVTWNWIFHRKDNLWIHCKDVESAKICQTFQSFCHIGDPFVFTTKNKIWLHDLSQKVDNNVIIPLLGEEDVKTLANKYPSAYAICTDYPFLLKNISYGKN